MGDRMNHETYPRRMRKLSSDSLRFIVKDAGEAITANPSGHKSGYYADEVNYAATELARREKAGAA